MASAATEVSMASSTPETIDATASQVEPDLLELAIAKRGSYDLATLIAEPGVLEFCQQQCFYLEEAKLYMQNVAKGIPIVAHSIITHHYVPFIRNYETYRSQRQYPDGLMAPGVSYLSAGCCLQHLMSTKPEDAASDAILACLYRLPEMDEQALVHCCLKLIHAKSCTNAKCEHDFCSTLKQVLAQADGRSEDYRICVQLERHLRRNRNNPVDPICSQVMKILNQTRAAAARQQQAGKNRSFSMPPKVNTELLQASAPAPTAWGGCNPIQTSYPGTEAAEFVDNMQSQDSDHLNASSGSAQGGKSPRIGRGRSKAHTVPCRPAAEEAMDDDED